MLDIRFLRQNFDEIVQKLEKRGEDLSELTHFGELDRRRREIIAEVEQLKAKRNEVSKQISTMKREKQDASAVIEEMQQVGKDIKALDTELNEIEEKLQAIMLAIPNIPHDSVPVGEDEEDNVMIRTWGEIPSFAFDPQAHWDIGTNLGIVDFERAAKVAGSRFVF